MIRESFLLKHGFRKIEGLYLKMQIYHVTHFENVDLKHDAFVYGEKPMKYITIILGSSGPVIIHGPHKGPRYLREWFPIDTEDEVLESVRSGGFFG